MGRLIVEAVSGENVAGYFSGTPQSLVVYVAVSFANDGSPVTGLSESNFEVAGSIAGPSADATVAGAFYEFKMDPGDQLASGMYAMSLLLTQPIYQGYAYVFLIRAHVGEDQGQTVVRIVPGSTQT